MLTFSNVHKKQLVFASKIGGVFHLTFFPAKITCTCKCNRTLTDSITKEFIRLALLGTSGLNWQSVVSVVLRCGLSHVHRSFINEHLAAGHENG